MTTKEINYELENMQDLYADCSGELKVWTQWEVRQLIYQILYDQEAQLKAKDEEIEKLKTIIEEAIMKPMGVEPHSWSDYKMQKDNA